MIATEAAVDSPLAHDHHGDTGLRSRSFIGLLVTQFLGAMNDNLFRWLAVAIGKEVGGPALEAAVVSGGAMCLVLPFLLLSTPAGYLADRFSKRRIIVGCKVAEIVIMLLGTLLLPVSNVYLLLIIVFLMGAQSALFSPSKLGAIPELVRADRIAAANALVALTTVVAIVLGTIGGKMLFDVTAPWSGPTPGNWWICGVALVGVALVGWFAATFIDPLSPANPKLAFPRNWFRGTWRDVALLAESKPILRVALGTAFFWSLAAIVQLNVDVFGNRVLGLEDEAGVGILLAVLSIGVGVGSVLAGLLSGGRVELGLVPPAALGVALSAMVLATTGSSFGWTCWWLFLLGTGAGLFEVPLNAYMQHRSPVNVRGSILAACNFLTFAGVLLFSALFFLLQTPLPSGRPLLTPQSIFFWSGMMTLPVAAYALFLLPQATVRFLAWAASHTIYRLRVDGLKNLPETGGALLVANHVSWIDGLLLLLTSSRPVRMVAYAHYMEGRFAGPLARLMGVIPIVPGDRRSVVQAIRAARQALHDGELVCIFPEGKITRSGQLNAFQGGFLTILKDTNVPLIPVYLDELWGSIFSFRGGKFFWKWPRQWPFPVTVRFGRPLHGVEHVEQARHAVEQVGVEALEERKTRHLILVRRMLRALRRAAFRSKISDSTGADLTGGQTLMRALIARRLLRKHVLKPDERYVGVLLPPSAPAAVINAALPLDGRIPVNLNYTCSVGVMNACIKQCGIRHVLTSHRVLEKLNVQLDAEVVCLEDVRERVSLADKLISALAAYVVPCFILERALGLTRIKPDDTLTVIFTSGSTGEPKGVVLSYHNIASNVDAIDQIVQLSRRDVLIGILPFFHSFGFTVTLWTVLTLDPKGAYHFSPLDVQQIGKLAEQNDATILISTPTFLRSYLKRITPEQFAALDVVVAGAEKLTADISDAFEQRFGVRPVEGYGATELSPLVSVNIPASRALKSEEVVAKEGTVGRPVPGVAAKVTDLDTGAEVGPNQPGLLWITGPNVMQGYLNQPEKTAEVLKDGWYKTGDVATIDADGFITITGRQSRFSKIGGEMVPHLKVEEILLGVVGGGDDELKVAVTGLPDPRKGERLVVLHTKLEKSPQEICKELSAAGLPNLWIPSPDAFCEVEKIPVLGTGKLDLRALNDLARERCASG